MIREVIWRSVALREFAEASQWYEKQRAGLGGEFLKQVEDLVRLVSANLQHFRMVQPPIRRALVQRFPYTLFFYERGKQVVILSLHHPKRDPKSWASRQE
jgi:toxin ParE1/3/4